MKQLRHILAAVDFSPRSLVALGFAARLGAEFKADLHVLHAQDPLLAAAAAHHGIDLTRDTEDELRAFVRDARAATWCGLHFHVVVGRASTAIIDMAERQSADVIVMAAHGMSALAHSVVGSTTEGVLRRSNVSVFVVPDQWTAATPHGVDLTGEGPVIVGVEPQGPAIEAAADAALLARALGTERILVHVVPSLTVLPRWRAHAEAALADRVVEARSELEQIAVRLNGGVPTRVVLERGCVARGVAEVARKYPHAIVAVGRSLQPHGHRAPGQTAYRILAETQLPILMHVAK